MILRMIFFNLIFVLTFNFLSEWYFYRFFIGKITKNSVILLANRVLNLLFLALYVLLFIFVFVKAEISHNVLSQFLFFYFLVYLPKFVYMIFSAPSILGRNLRYKKVFYWIGGVFAFLTFVNIIIGGTLGLSRVRVVETIVVSEKLPLAFDGFKIVHISDSHVGNMRDDALLSKVLGEIKAVKPNIIVFSGDLVHTRTDEVYKFRDVLAKFAEVAPVYTVLGNHDYGDYTHWDSEADHDANNRALEQFYADIHWNLMNNTSQVIHSGGDSIAILGIENWGESPFPKFGKLDQALNGVSGVPYKILVTHNPNHWVEEVRGKEDITLTLSGHTHAMQFVLSILGERYSPSVWKYENWGGLYREGDQYINVNEGMGIALIPMRIGTPPEVTVITLKK